jgi:putative transposase
VNAVLELRGRVPVAPLCAALGVSRATVQRRLQPCPPPTPRPTPARALAETERQRIVEVLCSPRFVDRAPAEVVHTLLDEGEYLASERTLYRVLAAHGEVKERRNQLTHPKHVRPELIATAPNEVWSWDITKLRTTVK